MIIMEREARMTGLKLLDNHCYQEDSRADQVMCAIDEGTLMVPGSNLGGL